jgi:hypothetical protein
MAWDILKNMLFVGTLYMVIPVLIIGALWSLIARWRARQPARNRAADGPSGSSGEAG